MFAEEFDIYKLLPGLETPSDADERVGEPIERFPFTRSLPDLHQAEIVSSPPPLVNTVSPLLTEEEATALDILFLSLPPDFIASLEAMDEAVPDLVPEPPTTPSATPTTPSVSTLPVSSASIISPTTSNNDLSVSPPADEHRPPIMVASNQAEESMLGPSAPRPTRRRGTPYPGASLLRFQPAVLLQNKAIPPMARLT